MIKFKLGEFVRFVEERREGYVTRIIDEQTIAVTDQDGFEIPVLASQVTRVHGRSEEQEVESRAPTSSSIPFSEHGISIAVVDDKRAGTVVHFHLINQTGYICLATCKTFKNQDFKGEFCGLINPGGSAQIFSASLSELDLWPEFQIQILKYSVENRPPIEPIVFKQKFRAKDFSEQKKLLPIVESHGWILRLDEPAPIIDAQKLKESFFKTSEEKLKLQQPEKVVDLHIEKLRDDHQFLNNTEKLNIQMEHFHKLLDAAIVHKTGSIIFIHGVGNGTLRNEIHKIISKHNQVRTFLDAYKEKFGYGATEVILK